MVVRDERQETRDRLISYMIEGVAWPGLGRMLRDPWTWVKVGAATAAIYAVVCVLLLAFGGDAW